MQLRNVVVQGNAHEKLYELGRSSVDLFLFSPPYDGMRDYHGFSTDLLGLGDAIKLALTDGGICAVIIQDQTKDFKKSLTTFKLVVGWSEKWDLNLWECLIYNRPGRPGNWWSKRFRVDHEYILIFFKGERPQYFSKEHMKIPCTHAGKNWGGTQRLTNGELVGSNGTVKDTKCPGTILNYASSNTEGNKLKLRHPATFPDKLASDLILAFTKPGMLVVDPMCGSGTTLVQAKKANRNYIGFDISEEYVSIAKQRLEEE